MQNNNTKGLFGRNMSTSLQLNTKFLLRFTANRLRNIYCSNLGAFLSPES